LDQELHVAVRNELLRRGNNDAAEDDLVFEMPDGSPLTAKQWSDLLNKGNLPTINISSLVAVIEYNSGEDDSPQEDDEDSSSSLDELNAVGNTDGTRSRSHIRPHEPAHIVTFTDSNGFMLEQESAPEEGISTFHPNPTQSNKNRIRKQKTSTRKQC
jgi:hypothetical protein